MKPSLFICGLAAAFVCLSAGAAASAAAPKNILPEASRTVAGGRTLRVVVAQEEIKSNINQSNIVVATGGGLIGALIDAKVNSDRAQRAEAAIQPLRSVLTGFDADVLALGAANAVAAKSPWFQAQASTVSRDSSILGRNAVRAPPIRSSSSTMSTTPRRTSRP